MDFLLEWIEPFYPSKRAEEFRFTVKLISSLAEDSPLKLAVLLTKMLLMRDAGLMVFELYFLPTFLKELDSYSFSSII